MPTPFSHYAKALRDISACEPLTYRPAERLALDAIADALEAGADTKGVTYTITEGRLVRLNNGRPEEAIDCAGAFDAVTACKRIADSEPRPTRNGSYSAHDIQSLQRCARLAFAKAVRP